MNRTLLALGAATIALAVPAFAQTQKPVPVAQLVKEVNIPFEQFTLDNGLRVFVVTDRKAPVVGVTMWYDVGSKQEPKGKTGFAHLFEHLMFGGSENVPNFDAPLTEAGSTQTNGSTWYDRTNYVETVPTGALERALYMESDRMGWLLGAVTQEKLDAQRGVVQNEKRQGDNQPFGLVEYAQSEALFPEGHPYRHSTIGSMADLDAASLEDVKNWFRQHYGPNNAILALAGDIDAKTARPLVEKYFGKIARGPEAATVTAPVPTLPERVEEVMKDRVATTRHYRNWVVPGLNHPDAVPLQVGLSVLGGLASSRLDNALVRDEETAVAVTAYLLPFEQISLVNVQADVRPGVDPAIVSKRLDELIAELIAKGPTADEVSRVATQQVAGEIAQLESVNGFGSKAATLAEGELYSDDPEFYKKRLARFASVTPAEVQAAMKKWLTRPAYALTVEPGERAAYEEAAAGKAGTRRPAYFRPPSDLPALMAPPMQAAPRAITQIPAVEEPGEVRFPTVAQAKLSNGITVRYAQQTAVPMTRATLTFDAGTAADPASALGTQQLMLAVMDEGTRNLNAVQLAEAKERLGAAIELGASEDRTFAAMTALTPNLAPTVALLADVVRNPAFAPAEVERLRNKQLAQIAAELQNPGGLASRTMPPLLFGPASPYGRPASGLGDAATVAKLGPAELAAFHGAWIRPDKAELFIVSDKPLAEILPAFEQAFGAWRASGTAGTKAFPGNLPAAKERIVLVDRPDSPQSVIYAAQLTGLDPKGDLLPMSTANTVLGDDFLSRINMDLRETKAWSYGARARFDRREHAVPYVISTSVQANRTGDSVLALKQQVAEFTGAKPMTAEEFNRAVQGNLRQLPIQFETGAAVLGGMQANALYDRPDDYYNGLAGKYRAMTQAPLQNAINRAIKPGAFTWVVVGDAKTVRAQLDKTGLPVEVVAATPAE
ncbi:insulinase family protein [Sphingomonas gilva]|uniref:Insulinase family protein n=1 Tax=Sphingomonas gilva TaxID=2305907 RepID=A0A396RYJ6_9SPHN|nr:pitrilysin family protein [Sphingomonas gilva]RHW18801.1 insulinase family protein [Sphingomonas gilva]